MKLTFQEALQKVKDAGACSPALDKLETLQTWEDFFAHEEAPYWSYWYARDVLKSRWPEGEETIQKDAEATYLYARDVIEGRWPEAEEVIQKDVWYTYSYARDVIEGRWPECEDSIKKNPGIAYRYARDVIRGRWSEVEDIIKKDAHYAYSYARDVLKSRWPEAEESIKKALYGQKNIITFFKKQRMKNESYISRSTPKSKRHWSV